MPDTPNKVEMLALAERCEKAEAGEQRELLEAAHRVIFPSLRSVDHSQEECEASDLRAFRFWRMLDAEAYESAAMSLVPEGWLTRHVGQATKDSGWQVYLDNLNATRDEDVTCVSGTATTEGLSRCAAALCSRASSGDTP